MVSLTCFTNSNFLLFFYSDLSDEHHCAAECRAGEYYCQPKGCMSFNQFCDGIIDCIDAADELDCEDAASGSGKSDNTQIAILVDCAIDEYKCVKSLECIPKILRCDGVNDCFDRTDEANCTAILKRPFYNETGDCVHPDRLCRPTGACISVHKLCDGEDDCIDGSDEGHQCKDKVCDHTTECSHFCHNAPEGFVCSCPLHMFMKPDGRHCSTEHACEHWGTCSQICVQVGKRYNCSCREGYTLQYDQFSCKSNNADSPYVIFSNRQEIRSVDLKTLAVRDLFSSLRNTIALDFLFTNESVQIFWTDVIDDKIYR